MEFKPSNFWVVLPDPTVTKTDSGIILDENTAKERATNILKVLAVGPKCEFVKVGDTVVVDPRTEAVRMEVDNKQVLMVDEHQIIGKQ
tara:strand:- start:143 stop:406 length:264 start_codon:yes stop_codon:yes gene_type:complete